MVVIFRCPRTSTIRFMTGPTMKFTDCNSKRYKVIDYSFLSVITDKCAFSSANSKSYDCTYQSFMILTKQIPWFAWPYNWLAFQAEFMYIFDYMLPKEQDTRLGYLQVLGRHDIVGFSNGYETVPLNSHQVFLNNIGSEPWSITVYYSTL